MRATPLLLCTLALGITAAPEAHAHDPGLSAAELRLRGGEIALHLVLARPDLALLVELDRDGDGRVSPHELAQARPALEALARGAVELRAAGSRLRSAGDVEIWLDDGDGVHFELSHPGFPGGTLDVRSAILQRLPRGHRQYVSLRTAEGRLLQERVVDAGSPALTLASTDRGGAGRMAGFRHFLALGIEHILTGYDHLLFLLGLLLAGGTLATAVGVVSSFTAAHSVTLALATLGLVRVPASVVEPLIALSIVYVGIENLLRRSPAGRWRLTFAFGLVHGLGFASVLRELGVGVGAGGVALPLVAFNLGVETGQLAIAAVAVPLLWALRRAPLGAGRWEVAASALIALAGGAWFLQRTLLA